MFRHRRQLRRWAARMLVLWLFGVGVGMANACLAPHAVGLPDGPVRTSAAAEVSHPGADADRHALHPGSHHSHDAQGADHDGPTASPNCQDFCDKVAVSMPPLKSALDQLQGHALPASAASTAAPVAPVLWVQPRMPRRHGAWAPPIPISFLRLAL
jgi:hypothetical protein